MPSRGPTIRAPLLPVLLLLASGGCTSALLVPTTKASLDQLLTPAKTAPDSVALEVIQLRVSNTGEGLATDIWQQVDEQRISVDLRSRLMDNGLRAGVLGTPLPDELARELNLTEHYAEPETSRVVTASDANPKILRRVLQLNRREKATVQAAELRGQTNLLYSDGRGLTGRSYQQAQAIYTLRAEASPGQRVRVRLTPELHHGEMRNRYSGSSNQGVFLLTPSREVRSFDELQIAVDLVPGEFLLVACLPDSPASLGHALHVPEEDGPKQQKLILLRPVEVPPSEILADAE